MLKPISTYFNFPKPIPTFYNLCNLFEPVQTCFKPIPTYFNILQPISTCAMLCDAVQFYLCSQTDSKHQAGCLVVWCTNRPNAQNRCRTDRKSIIFCESYKNVASVSTLFVRLTDLKL